MKKYRIEGDCAWCVTVKNSVRMSSLKTGKGSFIRNQELLITMFIEDMTLTEGIK